MALEIRVPSFGESITESTIAQWIREDGAWVEKGEAIVTLDTEKASSDIEAPASGVLKVIVAAGTDVRIGAVIAEIDDKASKPAGEAPAPPVASRPPGPQPPPQAAVPESHTPPAAPAPQEQPKPLPALEPLPVPEPVAASGRSETRKPMTRLRRTIARHLLKVRNETAMLTSFNEVDMSAVMNLRHRHQDAFVQRYGIKLGLMSFFVKASVEALRSIPEMNASIDGDDIVYHNYFDIGVAVSTERGLVVPVVRDADRKSFAEIENEIASLGRRAREGKIGLEEMSGGTFTITNGGVFGSMLSTPLLNPPQVGILGMHAITDRPVAVDGRVEVRQMMYLALSYDHRLIDGRQAVEFLVRLRDCIATPERMMLGL
jgi:2-oxoglutarate dehydrogenase E2 component (dihydrolipoamide succinyltransferase)